jgi:NhaP-type Na+/H+ or K+/H+ antiporter
MDPNFTVAIIGAVVLLGVFLKHFSKKTGWPLSLVLLLIGLFIGPVFGILDVSQFSEAIHSFAIIALVLVLFDTGYEIKLSQIKKSIFESTGLALIGVISTIFAVFLVGKYIMGLDPYLAVLFGALLASTDLTIIAPLMDSLKVKPKVKEALEIEATLNSVFAAVVAIIVGTMILSKSNLAEAISRGVFYHIFLGVAIGLMIGWILLKSMRYLALEDMPAIITIGAVLVVYAVTEFIGASGVIAALIVGLLYGNVKPSPPKFVMLFGDNLQMILVTFVYIFLGAMITFSAFTGAALTVLALVSAIVLIRYFSVKFVTMKESLLAQRVIGISGPRGIISAILVLGYASMFPNPNLIISLGFAVIFCTSLIVFLLPLIEKKTDKNIKVAGLRF